VIGLWKTYKAEPKTCLGQVKVLASFVDDYLSVPFGLEPVAQVMAVFWTKLLTKLVQAKRRGIPNLSEQSLVLEVKRRVNVPQPGAKQQDQQDAWWRWLSTV